MELSFSIISNTTGTISFALLSAYLLLGSGRRTTDKAILLAACCSTLWLGVLFVQALGLNISFTLRYTLELLRTGSLFLVMYAILGISIVPNELRFGPKVFFGTGVVVLIISVITAINLQTWLGITILDGRTLLILNVIVSLAGILLLEQIWRNSAVFTRSGIKFLSIALGTILVYDFVMYSDALLFKQLSGGLWDARGAVNALTTPLIAATLVKQRDKALGIHVSRQMVFHTTTLVLAGVYLLFVSAGGYYINMFGGTWGEALRVLFVFIAGVLMILVMSSPRLRAKTMVFISKNFFDYKYDYRDEWIKSTKSLQAGETGNSLPLRSAKTIAELVDAQSAVIWVRDEENRFVPMAQFGFDDTSFSSIENDSDLVRYFEINDWVINLKEYLADPDIYGLIELPEDVLKANQPWLIVPLTIQDRLRGFIFLANPYIPMELNWENYDLLKIVAQQACSYLEQQLSEEQLAQARQFEAVNQTSAFLIHDIKTIIAQLSMMVKNAPKHKSNPEFIDDMIDTTQHSVEKMEHLLTQIRNPNQRERLEVVNLCDVLAKVCYEKRASIPHPKLTLHEDELLIEADPRQLSSVIEHITQNAIEACDKSGLVELSTKTSKDQVFLFIQDNGCGMSADFIKTDLFKPFSSTKGLTGMGIGAYQSREYLRKIGGSISVTSEPDVGTCFTLSIPLVRLPAASVNNKEAN